MADMIPASGTMVEVTRIEYYTFITTMVTKYGVDNVVDNAKQFGKEFPYLKVYVNGEDLAGMVFQYAGGNSCMSFLDVTYVVDEAYLSYTGRTIFIPFTEAERLGYECPDHHGSSVSDLP